MILLQDDYCEYEFEYPPNYSSSLEDTKIDTKDFNFFIDNTFSNNYDINKNYLSLIKTKEKK